MCWIIFKSLSHFGFILVYDLRECSDFTDLHVTVQLSSITAEETVFSPFYILASFIEDELTIGVWVYFWALIHIFVSVPVPCCIDYCSFVVLSEV